MKNKEAILELVRFVELKTTQRPAFLSVAIKALEKQIPMKGENYIDNSCPMHECPSCGKRMIGNRYSPKCYYEYCAYCGQRVDWPPCCLEGGGYGERKTAPGKAGKDNE